MLGLGEDYVVSIERNVSCVISNLVQKALSCYSNPFP